MTPISRSQDVCRKLGFVLTCYVDGRKLFRAVRTSDRDRRAAGASVMSARDRERRSSNG